MAPRPDPSRANVVYVPDAHVALLRGDGLEEGARYVYWLGVSNVAIAWLTVRAVFHDLALVEVEMTSDVWTAAQLGGAWVVRDAT